ncbi:hypothetical protein [Methylosinus sp. KRF6]|uniref:hypothetical protein n=1 Tax=Methylosinus sp. KRF6 TaxID=2846853 RepID=UPI001C0E8E70|nr:hypothetical protein [Methylosinus sp. KRF6]MBU3890846.1 hypothetical protein [Methylosinus sp. KRF6]
MERNRQCARNRQHRRQVEAFLDRIVESGPRRNPDCHDHRRVASIFDPFGHIWALVQRKAEDVLLAA